MVKYCSTHGYKEQLIKVIDNIDNEIKLEYDKLIKYQEENTIDIYVLYNNSPIIDIDNYSKVVSDTSKHLNKIADLKKLKRYVENFINEKGE